MQKKLIALAVAGLASTAAFAQSNVTIYGRADFGALNTGGNSGGLKNQKNTNSFGSGLEAGSRIGFRGAEDLGNGLKAIFEIEYGISLDQPASATAAAGTSNANGPAITSASSAAAWTNRHSYVGLTGGFGTVVGGRLDGVRYGIFNTYDPFAGGTVGNFTQITRQVDRANNAIAYITPNFSGFTGTLAYGTHIAGVNATVLAPATTPATPARGITGLNTNVGEVVSGKGDLNLATIMAKYENGPISATVDYEQITANNLSGTGTLAGRIGERDKIKVWTVGGSYDFGVVKVSALYDELRDRIDGLGNVDKKRNYMLGAKAPFGKFVAKANWGRSQDRLNNSADVTKIGVGVDYFLSKRTNFYFDFGKIKNDSNSGIGISAAANAYGPTASYAGLAPAALGAAGSTQLGGVRGFDLGIAHNF